MAKTLLPTEDFIRRWNAGESIDSLMVACGHGERFATYDRAWRLRRAGHDVAVRKGGPAKGTRYRKR